MKIQIQNNYKSPEELDYEVVERKGIGHPDTIADAIAEKISVDFSKYCLDNFGAVLHHNLDKVAILGGLSEMRFGEGNLISPYRIYTNGRASKSFGDKLIPFDDIAKNAIEYQLKKILPDIDVSSQIGINYTTTDFSKNQYWFHPRDMNDLPEYKFRFANDTSTIISFHKYTFVEELVLKVEACLYKPEKDSNNQIFDFMGNDIKIMAIRNGDHIDLTACIPVKARFAINPQILQEMYEKLEQHILKCIQPMIDNSKYTWKLNINTSNKHQNDYSVLLKNYVVNIGSCLDFGEEGMVGRGNSRLGIIPVMRPYSMEAACGKNSYYHVGKVIGVLADKLSSAISTELNCPNIISLTCRHSDYIFDPFIICNHLGTATEQEIIYRIESIVANQNITNEIVNNELLVPRIYGQ